ncbi:putative NEK protein kinase [Blattamonas nauphoetae]|uniref:NEK protein kinase n=1 Tax=Blattamonas nauphoetae TaxID=2049346 RepID=A0ABQ9Y2P5_9EUKA|nr:putative NEK protein kinase [Blattamonas nauphoetae]
MMGYTTSATLCNLFMSLSDSYQEKGTILHGIVGINTLIERKRDKLSYCLKSIDESTIIDLPKFESSLRTLRSIAHNSINPIVDFRHENGKYYCVTPFTQHGTLKEYISEEKQKETQIFEDRIWNVLVQILSSLKVLDEMHMFHGNLRAENVIIGQNFVVRLTDAFLITLVKVDPTILNTRNYIAPEVTATNFGSIQSDLFSVGVLLYELLSFEHPFEGKRATLDSTPPKPLPRYYSDDIRELIYKLLKLKKSERPTLKSLLSHRRIIPLLTNSVSILDLCMDLKEATTVWDAVGTLATLSELIPNVGTNELRKSVQRGSLVQSLRLLLFEEKEFNAIISQSVATIVYHLVRSLPRLVSFFATENPQPKSHPAPSMFALLVGAVISCPDVDLITTIHAQAIHRIVVFSSPELRQFLFTTTPSAEAVVRLCTHKSEGVREKATETLMLLTMTGIDPNDRDDHPNAFKQAFDELEGGFQVLLDLVKGGYAEPVLPTDKQKKPIFARGIEWEIALNSACSVAYLFKGTSLPKDHLVILPILAKSAADTSLVPARSSPVSFALRALSLTEGEMLIQSIHGLIPHEDFSALPLPSLFIDTSLSSLNPSQHILLSTLRGTLEWFELFLKYASDETESTLSLKTPLFEDIHTLLKITTTPACPNHADPSDPVTHICCHIIHDICDGNALAAKIIDRMISAKLHTTLIAVISSAGENVSPSMLSALHAFTFGRISQMKTVIEAGVVDVLIASLNAKDPNTVDTALVILTGLIVMSGEDTALFSEGGRNEAVFKVFTKHQQSLDKTWFCSQIQLRRLHTVRKNRPVEGRLGEVTSRGSETRRSETPSQMNMTSHSTGTARDTRELSADMTMRVDTQQLPLSKREYKHVKGKHDMCALHSAVCLALMYRHSELPAKFHQILLYLSFVEHAVPNTQHCDNARFALRGLSEDTADSHLKLAIATPKFADALPFLILALDDIPFASKETKQAAVSDGFLSRMNQFLSTLVKSKRINKTSKAAKATVPPSETLRLWACLIMSLATHVLADCSHCTDEIMFSNIAVPVVAILRELNINNNDHSDLIRHATSLLFEICVECGQDEELESLGDLGSVKAAARFLLHPDTDISSNSAIVVDDVISGEWRLQQASSCRGDTSSQDRPLHPSFQEMKELHWDETMMTLYERCIEYSRQETALRNARTEQEDSSEWEEVVMEDDEPFPTICSAFDRQAVQEVTGESFDEDDVVQLDQVEQIVTRNRTLLACATSLVFIHSAQTLPDDFRRILLVLQSALASSNAHVVGKAVAALKCLAVTPSNRELLFMIDFPDAAVNIIDVFSRSDDAVSTQVVSQTLACLCELMKCEDESGVEQVRTTVTKDSLSHLSEHQNEAIRNYVEILLELL